MSFSDVSAEYQMLMEQFIALGDELDAMGEEDEDDQVRFKQILHLKTKRYKKKIRDCSHHPNSVAALMYASAWMWQRNCVMKSAAALPL